MNAFPTPSQPFSNAPGLVLELRKPAGAMGMISPVVFIDGLPAAAAWGTNTYPAPPGRRHVQVRARYLFEYGQAAADVDVVPGRTSVLHYSPPYLTFLRGRIGASPQPRGGAVALLAVLAVLVVLIVLAVIGANL